MKVVKVLGRVTISVIMIFVLFFVAIAISQVTLDRRPADVIELHPERRSSLPGRT